jgi:hypothetical protein
VKEKSYSCFVCVQHYTLQGLLHVFVYFDSCWVFVLITFCLPVLRVHDFAILSLPGAEAVKSQAGPVKPSTVEQIKNYSWPESKSCCYYGIQ